MMIEGIGTDVVQIPRIEKLLDKYGNKLVLRILSKEEIINFNIHKKPEYLARRFAAKEALFKALGVGIGKPLRFNDITIFNDTLGKPIVKINEDRKLSFDINSLKIDVSLSDDYPVAIAFVVISS